MIEKIFEILTEPSQKGIDMGIDYGELSFLAHRYEKKDNQKFLSLFNGWKNFKEVGDFFGQRVNLPEGLTEGVVAKDIDNVYRYKKSLKNKNGKSKFDCYNEVTGEIIEVKGCSISIDLTSWSPGPYFDVLYFVDFSSLDGRYKIFRINTTHKEIADEMISRNETFQDQIDSSRRPRFSLKEKYVIPCYRCSGSPVYEGDLNTLD